MATRWRWPPESWVGRAPQFGAGRRGPAPGGQRAAARPSGRRRRAARRPRCRGRSGARPGRTAGRRTRSAWPQGGELAVGQSGHVKPGHPHAAAARPVEGTHHVQQRGLARARRADDGHQLPRPDHQKLTPRRAVRAAEPGRSSSPPRPRAPARAAASRPVVAALSCGRHSAGTTTCWPAARPEPGHLDQPPGVVEQARGDRHEMCGAAHDLRPRPHSPRRPGPAGHRPARPWRRSRARW